MNPDLQGAAVQRLQRLNVLLAEGLALPADHRAEWLERQELTDAALVPRLRALLVRADAETDDFLRAGAEQALPLDGDAVGDRSGDEVGPYRLLSPLGHGGMAAVWLAERRGLELQRQVALKLPVNGWAAGPGLARRMAQERNILATLEHPRIARLYEAGVTAAGRPWLAMERVEGQPLDQWCRQHQPGVRRQLELFLQVAEAVSYAHARLVVHRDLKPANVLVDAQGDVHLLDFGIAKLLDETASGFGDAQLTRQTGRAVTPDYAAPEQMGHHPVTMACDVYSLGIVLYEMLAGERPYRLDFDRYGDLEAAALNAAVAPASSTAQRHDPRRAKALRGDLDTILAKALQKDPRDRYPSVESMADDVRRHLDGQPVLARTPSLSYLAAKLVRRHRAAVASGTAILFALGAGLALASWQWLAASRERDYTAQLLTRSRAAQEFSTAVLTEGIERDERVSLAELLQRGQGFIEREPGPVERAAAASTLASWYISYGNYKAADALLAKAVPQLDAKLEPELLQFMRCQQGHVWSGLGRVAEAEQRLLAVARHPDTRAAPASYCLRILAIRARNDNNGQAALDYANQSAERLSAAPGARPQDRALILGEQAYAEGLLGRPDLADGHFAQALDQFRQMGRGESFSTVSLLNNWAIAWLNGGRPRQAWPLLEQATAVAKRRSPTGELPAYLVYNRVNALRSLGRWDAALKELAPVRAAYHKGDLPPNEATVLWGAHFFVHAARGHRTEALQAFDEVVRAAGKTRFNTASAGGAMLAYVHARRALLLDQPAEAQQAVDSWLETMRREARPADATQARALMVRSEAVMLQGRADEALRDLEKARAAAAVINVGERPLTLLSGQVWLELGRLHQRTGRAAQAREAFMQAALHLNDSVGSDHPQAVEAAKALDSLH